MMLGCYEFPGPLAETLKSQRYKPAKAEPERLPTYSKREYFRPLSFSIQRKACRKALGLCLGLWGSWDP